jgi:cell wall-associated NlpC family hydrolase
MAARRWISGAVPAALLGPVVLAGLVALGGPAAAASPIKASDVPTPAASCGDLATGSTGPAVSTLQGWLGVGADGDFGPKTQAALVAWQVAHALPATGVIDEPTWAAMPQKVSWQACGQAVAATVPAGGSLHCAALAKGATGAAVAVLQAAVGASVDGGFGHETKTAVEAAQKAGGLTATGEVNQALWKALGLTGTPACEPGPPPTATGSGGGGTPSPPDAKKQARIRKRVARIVTTLTGPADTSSPIAVTALGFAHDQLGKPYLWGGVGPQAYDCSGLAMAAYNAAAITMPRVAADQYAAGPHVPLADAQRGDLVYWATDVANPSTIYHTGIYVGGGQVLDAPHTGTDVQVQSIWATDLMPKVVRPTAALSLPVRAGDTGPTVSDLQTALDHHGFGLSVDGAAGPSTIAAVKQWQRTNEVKATGRVTSALWTTLGWDPPGSARHRH